MSPDTEFSISFEIMNGSGITELLYCESIVDGICQNWGRFKQVRDTTLRLIQPENMNYIVFIIDCDSGYYNTGIKNIQVEIGPNATDYEEYISQSMAVDADGSVTGLTSLSPNMTLFTDTDGVTINCTYNADTKMYIDNKIAKMAELTQ